MTCKRVNKGRVNLQYFVSTRIHDKKEGKPLHVIPAYEFLVIKIHPIFYNSVSLFSNARMHAFLCFLALCGQPPHIWFSKSLEQSNKLSLSFSLHYSCLFSLFPVLLTMPKQNLSRFCTREHEEGYFITYQTYSFLSCASLGVVFLL